MRLQQLKLYETLLGGTAERARQLLSHQPFLRPLLDLLNQFAAAKTDSMLQISFIYLQIYFNYFRNDIIFSNVPCFYFRFEF